MSVHDESRPVAPVLQAWFIWLFSGLFFGFGFFHRVSPGVMIDPLMSEFSVGGALLGHLSAFYFYTYAALQIPVGLMVDRWGPRKILTFGTGLCSLGVVTFSQGETLWLLYLGRLLVGAGAGFGFVASLMLAARWFPAERFALVAGCTMTLGMAGGFLGQAPLAWMVELIGWREALLYSAFFGFALCLGTGLFVRDWPGKERKSSRSVGWQGLLSDLHEVTKRKENWLCAFCACSMTAPLLSFAGLWGVSWLMQIESLSRVEAASLTSLLLVGWAFGSPLTGYFSERVGRKRLLIYVMATGWLSLATLMFVPALPNLIKGPLFLLAGLGLGGMVINFSLVRSYNPESQRGLAVAFVNTAVVTSGAFFQPLLGAILDWQWRGDQLAGARLYDNSAYKSAFAVLLIFLLLGMVVARWIKEPGREKA